MQDIRQRILLLLLSALFSLTACSPKIEKEAPETPSEQLNITYCNISHKNLCVEGFGQEQDGKLLILLKAENPSFRDIYLQSEERDSTFTCLQSQNFPENLYCSGETFANGEKIALNIYTNKDKKLIASGNFTVQYGDIRSPSDLHAESSMPENQESTYSYPNCPNYPNYPNSTP